MDKLNFLNEVVFGYIKKDLENLEAYLPKKPGEAGNNNFPIALCVLAYMEYLGGFLLGKDLGFEVNVGEYIKLCFRRPDDYNIKILRDLFRHGLAHEYFARGGVSRDGIRPPLYRNYQNKVVLDAQTLLKDFLESLDAYRNNLPDDTFADRLKETEDSIVDWELKYKADIDSLPSMVNFPPHVRSSGATIYPEKTTTTLPYDPNEK